MRGASLVTLLAAVLVLGGALAAGHRHRVYDAVILKTLGATRRGCSRPMRSNIWCSAWPPPCSAWRPGRWRPGFVVTEVMNLTFIWLPGPPWRPRAAALLVTVALGLIGTFTALGQKPAPVLRNL